MRADGFEALCAYLRVRPVLISCVDVELDALVCSNACGKKVIEDLKFTEAPEFAMTAKEPSACEAELKVVRTGEVVRAGPACGKTKKQAKAAVATKLIEHMMG